MKPKYTNRLVDESSPYLLQHAHNPVNWHPWGEEALEKAKLENKLILVSIGYSACHWCHVMERESFENEDLAKLMNDRFVNIKVDREERPDVDQIYMEAVQLMTGSGGWPLNCFLLPDGRPIYGGTYFRPADWETVLTSLAEKYQNNPQQFHEYAERLTQGMARTQVIQPSMEESFSKDILDEVVENWKQGFDRTHGGDGRAPKFPMPNGLQFLLRHYHHSQDEEVLNQVNLTLTKMAHGGIYDQIGGGFARYSVDEKWKVPHFEKMLYDNAQLVSLYSEAFQLTKNELYKTVVTESLAFVERELLSPEGGFYSALDADSEDVEGKFYIWSREEIIEVLGKDADLFLEFYRVDAEGRWEDTNILLQMESIEEFSLRKKIEEDEFRNKLLDVKKKLLEKRAERIRPGLDDKILTSWNALMSKGYIDAYRAFGDQRYLDLAIRNMEFILKNCIKPDGQLMRSYKNGHAKINAFLDDYSFSIESLFALYQVTFDEQWLNQAKVLLDYVMAHFFNKASKFFYYTSNLDPKLISRKMELHDNVIPASNSSMAKVMSMASFYFDNSEYEEISKRMLAGMLEHIGNDGRFYSNWCQVLYHFVKPKAEVVISGEKALDIGLQLQNEFIPKTLFAGSHGESGLPFLKDKHKSDGTWIYVCQDKVCEKPTKDVEEAKGMVEKFT